MANVNGIGGYNKGDGTINKLLAAFGNDIVDVNTGLGYSLNLNSSNNVEFEKFLDSIFFQNYSARPKTFNGTVWSTNFVKRTPISKYIKSFRSRLYLGYCSFPAPQAPLDNNGAVVTYPSRVFFSDLFTGGGSFTWGIEWGNNGGSISQNSNIFQVSTDNPLIQNFKTTNIKVGDPLVITNASVSTPVRIYTVTSIDSAYRLTVDSFIKGADVDQPFSFWVGGNWFDVNTDDGDYITWLGESNDQLLVFKQFYLYRYNTVSLQKVKDSPGTTSGRSVINIGDYTIYFHGSNANTRKTGFYAYNGVNSVLISRKLQPYIDGISVSNYGSVIAWREGKKYRAFVGNLTNTPRNISVTNVVITWDTEGGQWSIDPISDVITASGKWIQSSTEKWFIGNNSGQVMETSSGNSHKGTDISWVLETGVWYPATTQVASNYTRIQVISRNAEGVDVLYKLYGKPQDDDDNWNSLGEIQHNTDEFFVPVNNNYGRGINIRFQERGQKANTQVIQKISIFYIPQTTRVIQ